MMPTQWLILVIFILQFLSVSTKPSGNYAYDAFSDPTTTIDYDLADFDEFVLDPVTPAVVDFVGVTDSSGNADSAAAPNVPQYDALAFGTSNLDALVPSGSNYQGSVMTTTGANDVSVEDIDISQSEGGPTDEGASGGSTVTYKPDSTGDTDTKGNDRDEQSKIKTVKGNASSAGVSYNLGQTKSNKSETNSQTGANNDGIDTILDEPGDPDIDKGQGEDKRRDTSEKPDRQGSRSSGNQSKDTTGTEDGTSGPTKSGDTSKTGDKLSGTSRGGGSDQSGTVSTETSASDESASNGSASWSNERSSSSESKESNSKEKASSSDDSLTSEQSKSSEGESGSVSEQSGGVSSVESQPSDSNESTTSSETKSSEESTSSESVSSESLSSGDSISSGGSEDDSFQSSKPSSDENTSSMDSSASSDSAESNSLDQCFSPSATQHELCAVVRALKMVCALQFPKDCSYNRRRKRSASDSHSDSTSATISSNSVDYTGITSSQTSGETSLSMDSVFESTSSESPESKSASSYSSSMSLDSPSFESISESFERSQSIAEVMVVIKGLCPSICAAGQSKKSSSDISGFYSDADDTESDSIDDDDSTVDDSEESAENSLDSSFSRISQESEESEDMNSTETQVDSEEDRSLKTGETTSQDSVSGESVSTLETSSESTSTETMESGTNESGGASSDNNSN